MIGRISGILFVCLLICSAVYYFFANQEITQSFTMFHIKARNFLDFLLPSVIGSFLVSLVFGVIISLFFSKNYAGGLYAIERDIQKFIGGNPGVRVNLRKRDTAVPLAQAVNELINSFEGKIVHIQNSLSNAQEFFFSEIDLTSDERLEKIREIHNKLFHTFEEEPWGVSIMSSGNYSNLTRHHLNCFMEEIHTMLPA